LSERYKVSIKDGIAYLKFYGEIGKDQLLAAYVEFIQHSDYEKSLDSLWDLTQGIMVISYQELKDIAEQVIASAGEREITTCSAFVTDDEGSRALLETYITLVSRYPTDFKIYASVKEAELWLSQNRG